MGCVRIDPDAAGRYTLAARRTPALYQVCWTDEIWKEVRRTLEQSLSPEDVLYRESAMWQFFPGAWFPATGYWLLVTGYRLPAMRV